MSEALWFAWLCPDCQFTVAVTSWSSVVASPILDAWAEGHRDSCGVSA